MNIFFVRSRNNYRPSYPLTSTPKKKYRFSFPTRPPLEVARVFWRMSSYLPPLVLYLVSQRPQCMSRILAYSFLFTLTPPANNPSLSSSSIPSLVIFPSHFVLRGEEQRR